MEQGLVHQRKAVRDDLAYYRTRFATEYALSLSVPNAAIADIHRRLAEGYRQRIDELGEMAFVEAIVPTDAATPLHLI